MKPESVPGSSKGPTAITMSGAWKRGFSVLAVLTAFVPLLIMGLPADGGKDSIGAGLQRTEQGAVHDLCLLYAVPGEACGEPLAVEVVAMPGDLPPAWAGFPTYAAGAADPPTGRILVVLSRCGAYPFGSPAQTLRHEVSHVLLYRSLGFPPPRWLDEGLAMRVSGEWGFSDGLYSLLALPSVARGKWRLSRVEGDFHRGESSVRRSYALAKGFVRDLFPNDATLTAFILEARRERSVEGAFLRTFRTTPQAAFQAWAKNLPWWGAWLSWFTSSGVLWVGITLLFLLAAGAAYRRRRLKYENLPD